MPIRPIDVRRKEFKSGFRGYDANQVDDFLDAVADEFERTYTENQRMREEVTSLRERLQQFEDLEGSIRAALVHAEQASNDLRVSASQEAEDVRRSARRDAEITVQEAQARSRQMLADSSARIERVQGSYEALQEAKRGFTNDFRNLLKTYMDVMENMEVASAKEIEASLHDRLDTEAIAIAREAAREQEEESARRETEASGDAGTEAGRTVSGHSIVTPAEVPDTQATSPEAGGTAEPEYAELQAVEDDAAMAGGERAPVADGLGAEDDRGVSDGVSDDAATQVLEPVGPTQAQREPAEPETTGTGPLAGEPETVEPEVEPEVEPSAARGQSMEDAAVSGSGPAAAEDVEREEPALAEESGSQDFFEQEKSPSRGDSRIFRASRFLRRRGGE